MRTNVCVFAGRIARDIEVRGTESKVARTTLAVERTFKREGDPDTDFVALVAFGSIAENMSKFLNKGDRVIVRTQYRTGSFTNKDGNKIYTHDFAVLEFDLIESKERKNEQAPAQQQTPPQCRQPQGTQNLYPQTQPTQSAGMSRQANLAAQMPPQYRQLQGAPNPYPQTQPMQNANMPGTTPSGYDDGSVPFSQLEPGGPMPWQ